MSGDTARDGLPAAGTDPAGDPSSNHRETANLVKLYFNVCNAALVQGSDGPLEETMVALLNQFASSDAIVVAVTGAGEHDRPRYATRFVDGQFTPISEVDDDSKAHFELEQDFLEEVADNSQDFITHPMRLDWSWVLQRD